MYSTGQNKPGVEDHGDDEYLSRKALQRYMHTRGLQEEEDETTGNGPTKNDKASSNGKDKNGDSTGAATTTNHPSSKDSADQDFENILRLDSAGDADGEDKLLSKLVDETNDKGSDDEDDDVDDEDDLVTSAGTGLLESLTTDIEKYHKRVQLKKKFDSSALAMEKKIANDLTKSNDDEGSSSKKRSSSSALTSIDHLQDDDDDDEDASGDESSSKRLKSGSKKVSSWTKAEDDAIVYYKEEMKYSWKKIEELLEKQHSWQAIQMRYLRNHKSRNEEWSRFMEIRLINAVRKDWENRWKRISADLGKDFGPERCTTKNIEICKKMELPYFGNVFKNKDITAGYKNQFNDIKDAEAHKKLMLVYMGLDSITYEDSDNEDKGEPNSEVPYSAGADKSTANTVTSANTTSTSTPSTAAAAVAAIADKQPVEPADINKLIGMNMNIDVDSAPVDDLSANVDPAITGEGLSKE